MRIAVIITLILFTNGCAKDSKPNTGEFLQRGNEFMKTKDYARAILQFKNEAQLVPTSAEPHYQLALAYLALENLRDAVAQLREATKLDPQHVQAQLKLAEIFSSSRNKETLADAEKRIKDVLAVAPDTPDALSTLAFTELGLGKVEDATERLEAALKRFPDHLKSAELLAMIKSFRRDLPGAESTLRNVTRAAPKSADAAVALGSFYLLVRKDSEAEAELRRALGLDSSHSLALADLALVHRRGGRTSEAEVTYKRLSDATDDQYKFLYGQFLFEQGKRDAGVAEFQRLVRKDPKNRKARTNLVAAYVALNRLEDAEKVLSSALRENPKNVEALLQRGEIRLHKSQLSDAQNDLNQVLSAQPDSAEAHFILSRLRRAQGAVSSQRQELDQVLRLNPGLLRARLELAREQISERKADAALQTLDHAPEQQKSNVALIEQRNWALLALGNHAELKKGIAQGLAIVRSRDLLLQDALFQMSRGNYPAARSSAEEVLKHDPEDLGALEDLMLTYAYQKQAPAGIQRLRQILSERPPAAATQLLLGRWLEASGKRSESGAAYEAAKKAAPGAAAADFALARLDFRAGAYDSATKRFSTLRGSPEFRVQALLWLGQIEEKRGNGLAALELYREAVEKDRRNATALNNLAYLLADIAGRPDEALQYAQQAKELLPNSASIDDTIGWAYYKKAIYHTAVGHLEKAAAKNSSPRVKYHLAMAYARVGNQKRGRITLESALKQDPNLPEARVAREMMPPL
jgi:tetratricopeptide (TPR) repeat protein